MSEPEQVFGDEETLGEARRWLRERAMGGGANCPLCHQHAKIYHRPINAAMARMMIDAWRVAGHGEFHQPTQVPGPGGDYAKLRYWGLIEDVGKLRADGGKAGWWRITDLGEAWVRGLIGVPKYVYVYDNKLLRFDQDCEQNWSIRDALGERFDYEELMGHPGASALPV
jgi:hypothetical protein